MPALIVESFTCFAKEQMDAGVVSSGSLHETAHTNNADVIASSAIFIVRFISVGLLVYTKVVFYNVCNVNVNLQKVIAQM